MLLDKKNFKEMQLDEQVGKALEEKHKIADRQLFVCSHCGSKNVDVDFVSDEDDYLCECPNCGEIWTYSKEEFNRETSKQNWILAKAKRYWKWHYGSKLVRFMIVLRVALDIVLTTFCGLLFIGACMVVGGAL